MFSSSATAPVCLMINILLQAQVNIFILMHFYADVKITAHKSPFSCTASVIGSIGTSTLGPGNNLNQSNYFPTFAQKAAASP